MAADNERSHRSDSILRVITLAEEILADRTPCRVFASI